MKRTFTIMAEDDNGIRAVILVETEENWVPLEKKDVGKVDTFIPSRLYELSAGDEMGSRDFLLEQKIVRGSDFKRRKRV